MEELIPLEEVELMMAEQLDKLVGLRKENGELKSAYELIEDLSDYIYSQSNYN